MQSTQGKGNGAYEVEQSALDRDGAEGMTVPPQAADGEELGSNREAVGGRWKGTAESTHGAIVPVATVVAAASPGQEGLS